MNNIYKSSYSVSCLYYLFLNAHYTFETPIVAVSHDSSTLIGQSQSTYAGVNLHPIVSGTSAISNGTLQFYIIMFPKLHFCIIAFTKLCYYDMLWATSYNVTV